MKNNSAMKEFIAQLGESVTASPQEDFEELAGGLTRENGCVFLTSQSGSLKNVTKSDFPDFTGLECFINHVHIDEPGARAFRFLHRLKELLSSSNLGVTFRLILAGTNTGWTVRFHVLRENENFVAEDLEAYTEAVLVLDQRS